MPLKPFLKVYKPTGVNGEAFFGINLSQFHLFLTRLLSVIRKFENVLNKPKMVFYL